MFVVPPSLLPDIFNLQPFKHVKPFSLFLHDTPHKQPWHAILVAPVGPARGFSSHLVALVICLSSFLDFRKVWLASFFFVVMGSSVSF